MTQQPSNAYFSMLESRRPIIFDGAMGTQILESGVRPEDYQGHDGCNEYLAITRPEIIIDIHKRYLNAGANVIETNSFGGNLTKLTEYGLVDKVHEVNRAAAELARKAISEAGCTHDCLVCGTMGPTGLLSSSAGSPGNKPGFRTIAAIYATQAEALLAGGADILLLETMHDLLELRAAIWGIRHMLDEKSLSVPLQVHATVDAAGKMLLGSDIPAFLGAVGNLHIDCLGLNCSTGPKEMQPHTLALLAHSPVPVSMLPNAGMPENVGGKAVYKMDPTLFAEAIAPLVVERGLSIVGGCCGTTPEHIAALSKALAGKSVAPRSVARKTFCATGISGRELEVERKPFIVGERLNTQGSKKTKELVLSRNFDELYQMALQQADKGSSVLDICVAITERDDEADCMAALVSFLSERVSVPFCIDSTDPAVIRAALEACPGSALINSINLEHNGKRARDVLTLAREFGCPVVALTIDNDGMAKTLAKKIDIARRLRDLACNEFLLPEHFLYVDPLTFTLATGDPESADAAKISLEALFRIREEMPNIRTIMGVSNVSFGLAPASRRVLNNVMLHYAAQAGLDASIYNPLHLDSIASYDPAIRGLAEDLLFNRRPSALADFVAAFSAPIAPAAETNSKAAALPPDQLLRSKVLNRDRRDLVACIDVLLGSVPAKDILNTILLPAMAEVGAKMDKGEMILPFVLQAAEIMKEALTILEPHLAGADTGPRGKIVMATVYGDVHDIGKNLVASILKNQGYDIVDLGKQVPTEAIVAAVRNHKPDAIGLSALLVNTSKEMSACVTELDRQGLSVPLLVGGAAVNKAFAERIAVLENGKRYLGGVYYAKDAFEAARILDALKTNAAALPRAMASVKTASVTPAGDAATPLDHPEILTPQFYGTNQVLRWDTETLLAGIDTQRLFKSYFGGGNLSEKDFAVAVADTFLPAFEQLNKDILSKQLCDAAGLYGIFPVFTHDTNLVLLSPDNFHSQLAEFNMPRQPRAGNRSLADFFNPVGDVVGLQVVTLGGAIDREIAKLGATDKYSQGFFLNAIANYLTEQLANKASTEIRRACYLATDRGRRYSFGYPGLPGVEKQAKLFEIMGVEERLGITLTSGSQMVPEHSTMGIFVHHPQAEYL
jgi:5-methyltetrahydrofolate--homocysteine methyltransferase